MPLINFAGLASGIDSNALIDATLTAQRKQKVQPKKDKITDGPACSLITEPART